MPPAPTHKPYTLGPRRDLLPWTPGVARYALLAGRAQFLVEGGESALSLKMRSRLKNPAKGLVF
ncbi:MAG: hypothetical protein EXR77_16160 [Myxococcales bacterium]|nr:hypothetical protein [Myxococcales bacterium]